MFPVYCTTYTLYIVHYTRYIYNNVLMLKIKYINNRQFKRYPQIITMKSLPIYSELVPLIVKYMVEPSTICASTIWVYLADTWVPVQGTVMVEYLN